MTIMTEAHAAFRVEELFVPGIPEKKAEIIEGELVVMSPAGWAHNVIAGQIFILFHQFCQTHPDLFFGGDNDGFLLRRNPDVMLSPDVSLFRKRKRANQLWMDFAPEIAVEVLSPSNNASEIAYKRRRYFDAGTEQVWLVDIDARSIDFYFREGVRVVAQGNEVVKAEGIADGLEIDMQKLFSVIDE